MSISKAAASQKREEAPSKGPGRPLDAGKGEAIIRAAQQLFLQKGFDNVSVEAIAEAAGVAKATVYKRFPDKETLLREAITTKCASYMDGETLTCRPGRALRVRLHEIGRRFLSLVTDPEALAMVRLIMQEGERGPQLPTLFFESAIQPTCAKFAAFLAAEAERGALIIDDSQSAAWRFLGMVKGQDHMRAMLGVAPRTSKEIEAHIAACVDDFIAAHAPRA